MKNSLRKVFYYFKILPFVKAFQLSLFYSLRKILNPHSKVFFSQHGEDGLIQFLIGESEGFYIDVGCNHPIEISNTFRFYLQGWKGLCIDANKRLTENFERVRRRDKVVCNAISDKKEELEFFEFHCDTVSTINKAMAVEREAKWALKEITKVTTRTLDSILEEVYPDGCPKISLVSIDVEGYSLQALKSLDLKKYAPRMIVIEIDDFDFGDVAQNDTVAFLKQYHYNLEAFDSKNGYFILEGQR